MDSISLQKLSKTELEILLRELRSYRQARKKIGSRAQSKLDDTVQKIRVELPIWADTEGALELLKKLKMTTDVEFIHTAKLTAGVRIFEWDTLYDGSLSTLTQKI